MQNKENFEKDLVSKAGELVSEASSVVLSEPPETPKEFPSNSDSLILEPSNEPRESHESPDGHNSSDSGEVPEARDNEDSGELGEDNEGIFASKQRKDDIDEKATEIFTLQRSANEAEADITKKAPARRVPKAQYEDFDCRDLDLEDYSDDHEEKYESSYYEDYDEYPEKAPSQSFFRYRRYTYSGLSYISEFLILLGASLSGLIIAVLFWVYLYYGELLKMVF